MKLINIGFGNIVSANRLVAIVSPESAPIKRIIQEARERGMLVDATYGRRTRAVIITDSDHIILSAVQPETVAHRLNTNGANPDRVMNQLAAMGLIPENWGGDTIYVPVSAIKGEGIEDLLEAIILIADLLDLRETLMPFKSLCY